SANRLGGVRNEIAAILPETQVTELASQALARAEARNRAAAEARDANHRAAAEADTARKQAAAQARVAVEGEKKNRARLRGEQESFAAVLVPIVLAGCVVWLGVLAFSNVRERAPEIGILRALGLGSGQVVALFLVKALAVGFLGALLGYAAGTLAGTVW